MFRAVLLGIMLSAAAGEAVSPVQKVIELLEENKGKIAADLAAEEKEMVEYSNFCDDESTEKGYAIKTATRTIGELEAVVADGEAQVASLEDEVATLGTEVAAKERALAGNAAVRAKEKAAFEKNEKELITSVDELERAVSVVKKDEALIQTGASKKNPAAKNAYRVAMRALSSIIDASWVNTQRRKALKGLLQTQEGDESDLALHRQAPAAKAFESSTGGIVGTLEDMKEKAEEALSDARNNEMKEGHSFDMMSQSLTDAMAVANERLASAKSAIEAETEEIGKATNELMETKKTKSSDEAYLASLTKDCAEASSEWAQRQASAKEEVAVIDKAKGILADRVKVFVQRSSNEAVPKSRQDAARTRIVSKLQALSRRFRSYALMEMVTAAAADPFEKIRGLIEQMITKLLNEANEETTQKAFCDEEMKKSTAAKEDKTMRIEKLQSRLDKATASKAELEALVKDLEAEIAELDQGDAEATKLRNEAHASYLKASKDFKEAAEAVEAAMTTLKEYYEGALVQTGLRRKAPTFGGAKSDSASVILGILEVSAEDFTRLYMETEQSEAEAARAYEKLTQENKVARTAKATEVKATLSEINSLDVAMKNSGSDVDITSKELDAVLEYMDKLKPQCESKAMSYAERKSRREAEIEGLKEALAILEGEVPALVQMAQRLRGQA